MLNIPSPLITGLSDVLFSSVSLEKSHFLITEWLKENTGRNSVFVSLHLFCRCVGTCMHTCTYTHY